MKSVIVVSVMTFVLIFGGVAFISNQIGRDTGTPARGWHGEAYRGHVFWDEAFILPFFTLRHLLFVGALLAIRLEFLMDDWLWLIDPIGKRS